MSDEKIMCPGCPHPVRRHTSLGCQSNGGACECALTPQPTKGGSEAPEPAGRAARRSQGVTFHWEEPPAQDQAVRVNQEYMEIAAKLREQPGRWARIFDNATSGFHSSVSNGRLIAFRPKGAFHARSKRNPDGTRIVWVRYVGGDE